MNAFRTLATALTAAVFLAVGASAPAAAAESPTDFLKSKDKALKPLLANTEKNKKKIVKTISSMMDFSTLCKDSLGKHWDARTEAERAEFSDTLKALIEKNLIKRLKDSKDNVITYGQETVKGNDATVATTVKMGQGARADETEIVYKMKKKGASWIVVDMVTDEISLIGNYREQFNAHINKDGFEGLMKKMKDKLSEKD